ncbi:cytidine deaminase [Portibacter marinus]|uniref:cytidine deaminase n=1 Tax=Portibacter marinus TaxID=2898660 RepID=UPI001F2CC365|nr:cytidine deaminase [Portibacter marinus]
MKIKTIHQDLKVYSSIDELEAYERDLISKAISFLDLSYAPYSKFHVATALLLENDEVISGANQENASYPLCLCAERVALHHAAMRHPGVKIKLMALTARNEDRTDLGPIPPCGACRQVIAEYQEILDCKIRILMKGDQPEILELSSIEQVLPLGFNSDFLQSS